VCFEYEYFDAEHNQWYRAYGNENWEFDSLGLMRKRIASINEARILDTERRISLESPVDNAWLNSQGIGMTSLPLQGGSTVSYSIE